MTTRSKQKYDFTVGNIHDMMLFEIYFLNIKEFYQFYVPIKQAEKYKKENWILFELEKLSTFWNSNYHIGN